MFHYNIFKKVNWLEYNESFDEDDNFANMEDKIKHYQRIIRNAAKNRKDWPGVDVIESMVDYCIATERFKEALEFCNIWLEYIPDTPDALHKRAVIYYQLNDPMDALHNINRAIRFAPADRDLLLTKALILEQFGNIQEGLQILNDFLSSEPGNEDALFKKSILLQSAGRYNEALEILKYLENIDFTPEEVWQELANCYQMLEDYKNSELYYNKSIAQKPFDYLIWYNFGVMYGNKGANYKAIDCYLNSLAIKDNFISALFNLGNTYSAQARIVEAIETYQTLLGYIPNDIDALFNLAGAFADNRQYLSAIETYTRVINLYPAYHQAYFGRGYCYDRLDNYEEALKDYNLSLRFLPDSMMVLQAKADLLYNSGKVKESLPVYLQALELSPYDEHCLFDAAQVYFELNDLENSEFFVNKLLDVSYSYADGWYLLGKINLKRFNERKAIKCFSESIKIDKSKYDEFSLEFSKDSQYKDFKIKLDKNIKKFL